MTGLVAVVANDASDEVTQSDLDALASDYEALRGRGDRHVAVGGRRVMAAKIVAAGTSPDVERNGASWALAVGAVHAGPASATGVGESDGQFAVVAYDADGGEVRVVSDPFGMQALFVAERGKKTYISTSALALASHLRARPDRFGLLAFLRAGYHFSPMTHWEGIERLEPATFLRFGQDGRQRVEYFRPEIDADVARLPLSRAVDHCIEVADDTYRRYLGRSPRSWADLTGGYDSRLLVLLLREAGVQFDTDTRGFDESPDVRISRQLAELAGWNWLQLRIPDNWSELLPKMISTALVWGDAHLEVTELAWVLWAHAQAGRRNPSLLIAGGGEHYRGFAWRQEFLNAGRSNRVNYRNWIDMRLLNPMDVSLFASDPTPDVRENFRARMVARAQPYASEPNTTQLEILYAYKGTGHFGAYLSADSGFLTSQLPYYFRPVFRAGFSVDHRFRSDNRLMRHMIERLDARMAAVPTTIGGPAQPWRVSNSHRFLPYYAEIGRKAIRKLSQKTLGRTVFAEQPSLNMRAFGRAVGPVLRRFDDGQPLRHARMRSAPLFAGKHVDELFRQAENGALRDTRQLGRILTIELALRTTDAGVDS